jgi:hypothetical protein
LLLLYALGLVVVLSLSLSVCLILLSSVEQKSFAGGADSISHGWMERLFLPSLYNNNNNNTFAAV